MANIFVTGADGFIGSHLVERLVLDGHNVKALSMYNSFNSWGWLEDLAPDVLDSIEVISGDIRDQSCIYRSVKGSEVIYHLASLIGIPYSYEAPYSYIDTNINGTLNVMQAARDLSIERVLHTSTSEVYGTAKYVPIDEEHPLQGQSPYSASKIGADQIAYSFFCSFKTPVSIVRPFNTYGPRQSARAVIPTIITQIANGVDKLKLGSLTPTRDFNYVSDTVEGFIQIAESLNCFGEVLNVGSGFEVSIEETARVITKIMGRDVEIIEDEDRIRPAGSEVNRLFAGIEKIKKLTNFSPAYSQVVGLEKGLEKTIEWFQNPTNLKKYKHDIYNV